MVIISNKFEGSTGKRARLRDWILDEIRFGRLKSGDTAPTRFNLAKTFNCSRATADYVIKDLIRDNILVAEQGKALLCPHAGTGRRLTPLRLSTATPSFPGHLKSSRVFFRALETMRGWIAYKDVQMAHMDEVEPGQYPFSVLCAEKLTTRIGQEAARLLLQGEWPEKQPLQRLPDTGYC